MTEEQSHRELLPATGVVLVHDFCRAAGIDQQRLLELAEAGVVSVLYRNGEPFGLLDDRLPTAAALDETGVRVPEDYLSRLRHDLPEDSTPAPPGDASWTMGWD